MPQLDFKGKQFVQNLHFTVPFHTLDVKPAKAQLLIIAYKS